MPFFSAIYGLLAGLARGLRGVFRWVLADWRHGPLLALGIVAIVHWTIVDPGLRSARDTALISLGKERRAHTQTVANYRAAAAEARDLAQDNIAQVKAAQDSITEEIVDDYEMRIADARRRAAGIERMRADAGTGADRGSARAPDLSDAGSAPSGADQAAGEARLSACLAPPDFTLEDALIATEQAIQLDALIDWVEAQAAVDTNGSVAP